MNTTTLSPQKAITYSYSPVPPQVIDLVLITHNLLSLDTSFFPPTLVSLTLQHFDGLVETIPQTVTQLVTTQNFSQPVDKLPPALTHLTSGEKFNLPVNAATHTHSPHNWILFQPTC
jgi:hypothetical protein